MMIYFIHVNREATIFRSFFDWCLILDGGVCFAPVCGNIDLEDLEVCDIIMRIDLLMLWPEVPGWLKR